MNTNNLSAVVIDVTEIFKDCDQIGRMSWGCAWDKAWLPTDWQYHLRKHHVNDNIWNRMNDSQRFSVYYWGKARAHKAMQIAQKTETLLPMS